MTLIIPIVSFYYFLEEQIYKTSQLKDKYKILINLSVIVFLEILLFMTTNISIIYFDFSNATFTIKNILFESSYKFFVMYVFAWISVARLFSCNSQIKPIDTLYSLILFSCLALEGPFTLLCLMIGFFALVDIKHNNFESTDVSKYILILCTIFLALITHQDYENFFPVSFIGPAHIIECVLVSILALMSDYLLPKKNGFSLSAICFSLPFILYFHSIMNRPNANEDIYVAIFGLFVVIKILMDWLRLRGARFLLLFKNLFPLLSVLFYENKFFMLAVYIALSAFMQVYNKNIFLKLNVNEKADRFLKSRKLMVFYSISLSIFLYLIFDKLFEINFYIASMLSILSTLLLKDVMTVYLAFSQKSSIYTIYFLTVQLFFANAFLIGVR